MRTKTGQRTGWLALVIAWWFGVPGGAVFADMLPSGLTAPSSVYGASYTDVAVPDAGAAVSSAIVIGGAPVGAIVTRVEVAFDVAHEYSGDLAVSLVANNSAGQQRTHILWNPGNRTATGLAATTVTSFNGAPANQSWQLILQDTRAADTGSLDQWSIRVYYLAPPSLRLPGTESETSYLIGTLAPSLQWNTALGASRYQVRLQASPYDALLPEYEKLINGTAATLPLGRLQHGATYRWQAKSIPYEGMESGFGAPLYFATPPVGTLVPPTLTGPGNSGDANRALLPNAPPQLRWSGVVGATGYKVYVSEYPYEQANQVLVQSVGAATSFTPSAGVLIPGVRYRWTATALYSGGKESTPWQSALYFELGDPNAPQITSAFIASGTRGSGFNYAITATNNPTSYAAVELPEGLSVNASTGVISGSPAVTGAHNVLVQAFNALGGSNRLVILDVRPPVPVITSTGSSSAVLGQPFSYQIVATENPTSYAATNLPAGLLLDPLSGLITGAIPSAGDFTIALSATNSGGTGTKNLTLGVASGPPYDTKLAPRGVHENQPIGTVVGNFNTLDGDPGQTFTYSLVSGAGDDDNAQFQIFANEATLRTKAVFDYETRNTYSIRVRTTDSSGQFLDKQITVRVLNVIGEVQNGVQLSDARVLENQPAGSLVGFLSAVDPDPGETFTFNLVSGSGSEDNASFSMGSRANQSGQQVPALLTAVSFDYEAKRLYSVRLRVTDSGGNMLEKTAVIEVLDDASEDFDGDGLTQGQEAVLGTSDLLKDADGDGAGDGVEATVGTNPLDSSSFPNGTVVTWGEGGQSIPSRLTDVVQVAGGAEPMFNNALKRDGTVVGWYKNGSLITDMPPGLANVVSISAGWVHVLALRQDGTVMAWGEAGPLNRGQWNVPAGLNGVVAVAAGAFHSLALKSDGTVVAWGLNTSAQSTVPSAMIDVVGIAGGYIHSLALKANGSVVAWGDVQEMPPEFFDVRALAAAGDNVLSGASVLRGDGTVWSWFNRQAHASVPVGLETGGVTAIASFLNYPVALRSDGTVWDNPALEGIVAVSAGLNHGLAIRSHGLTARISEGLAVPGRVSEAFSHQIATVGGSAQSYAAMGLPPGLSLNASTGLISGTPTTAGRHAVRLIAKNSFGWDSKVILMPIIQGSMPSDLSLASSTILENQPAGSLVGFLSAVDADPGESFTFNLVSGPGSEDNASFSMGSRANQSGQQVPALVSAASFDYEAKRFYSVRLRVTDSGGNMLEKTVVIEVLDDTSEDSDGDGLTQAQETVLGTSDLQKDADGDGAGDGVEVTVGTNPLDSSSFPNGTVMTWGEGGQSIPSRLTDVVQVAGGAEPMFNNALKRDGTVVGWYKNGSLITDMPPGLANVVSISAGWVHVLALRQDGTVMAWGEAGELNRGQWNVPAGLNGVVAVAAGAFHSLALKSDGTVVAWGLNTSAQSTVPSAMIDVVGIAGGYIHSLALKANGSVVAWGDVQEMPPEFVDVRALAAGGDASLSAATVLRGDGTVRSWINRQAHASVPSGLEGGGVTAIASFLNYPVALRSDGTVWDNPALEGIVAVSAGLNHGLAIRSHGLTARISEGLAVPGRVSEAFSHQIATVGGSAQSYAAMGLPPGLSLNASTGLISGTPTTAGRHAVRLIAKNSFGWVSKVILMPIIQGSMPSDLSLASSTILENQPAGSLVGFLSAVDADPGESFTFNLVSGPGSEDNASFSMGSRANQSGQQVPALVSAASFDYEAKRFYSVRLRVTDSGGNMLEKTVVIEVLDDTSEDSDGDGLTQAQETVLGTSDLQKDADGDGAGDGVEVTVGTNPLDSSSFPNGTVMTWGEGGQSIPSRLTDVVQVAGGAEPMFNNALKRDGTVVGWYKNGSLITDMPPGLANVVSISAGWVHVLALRQDGTVMAWGEAGELNRGQWNVPAGLNGVVAVAAGAFHSLALKSDGTVVAWGLNTSAQSTVPSAMIDVVGIAGGYIHSLALKANGSVVAWGDVQEMPPEFVDVRALAAGGDASLSAATVLRGDGTVRSWINRQAHASVPSGLEGGGVTAIASFLNYPVALRSDGTVWDNPALEGIVAVSAGLNHGLAIRSHGLTARISEGLAVPGRVSEAFSHQIATVGGSAQSYAAMGLPPGLSLNASTGLISGTPTTAGRHAVRLIAKNSFGWVSKVILMPITTGSPPTAIGLTSGVVAEDVPVGTVVARILVTDADFQPGQSASSFSGQGGMIAAGSGGGDSFTYALIAGPGAANNSMFEIEGDALVTAAPLDYESVSALHVRIRVTDSGLNTLERELTIQVLDVVEGETLTNWKARLGITNLLQTTGGDGMTALHKYAFGLDPAKPGTSPVQPQRTPMSDGEEYLTVAFPRAFGGTTNPDGSYTYAGLTYRVEWSSDLVNWSGAGVEIIASGPAPGSPPGYRLVTARSPVSLGEQPRQFMRVVLGAN